MFITDLFTPPFVQIDIQYGIYEDICDRPREKGGCDRDQTWSRSLKMRAHWALNDPFLKF